MPHSPAAFRSLLLSLGLLTLTACGPASSGAGPLVRTRAAGSVQVRDAVTGSKRPELRLARAAPAAKQVGKNVAAAKPPVPALQSLIPARSVGAAPGSLDQGFGTGGKVLTPLAQGDAFVNAVAVQRDGKVVVVGRVGNGNGADVLVMRYTAEGRLDPAFGGGGVVVTDLNTSYDSGNAVLLQPDGKIVVGGSTSVRYRPESNETQSDFALVRYTPGGALDPSFGRGGKVATAIGQSHDGAYAVALQPDGKIVLAGSTGGAGSDDVALSRYHPDGRLDAAFGQGGRVVTSLSPRDDAGSSVALQPDGRVVVAGRTSGSGEDVALLRYTAAGRPDPTFGQGGAAITDLGGSADAANAVALQPDGKVLVAGSTWNGEDHDVALLRFGASGQLDPGFGTGGKAVTAIGSSQDLGVALLQPGNKIVVVGRTLGSSGFDVGVVQYAGPGAPDPGFGRGGKVSVSVGTGDDLASGAALQPGGKLIVAGSSSVDGKYVVFLLRLWP